MNQPIPDDEDREYIIGSEGVVKRTDVSRDSLLLMTQLVEYRADPEMTAQIFNALSEKYGSVAALAYKGALILTELCVTTPLIDKLMECGVSYEEITGLIIAATRRLEDS